MNEYIAQAENSLAGCLLVTPEETIRKVAGIVTAGDFLNDSVRRIYSAAKSLVTAGRACDAVLIQAEASKGGTPIDTEYCAECMRFYLTTANVEETAKVIHDAAIRRRAAEIGISLVHEELAPVEGLAQLQELVKNQSISILTPADAAQQVMDRISETADGKRKLFLPTGFSMNMETGTYQKRTCLIPFGTTCATPCHGWNRVDDALKMKANTEKLYLRRIRFLAVLRRAHRPKLLNDTAKC